MQKKDHDKYGDCPCNCLFCGGDDPNFYCVHWEKEKISGTDIIRSFWTMTFEETILETVKEQNTAIEGLRRIVDLQQTQINTLTVLLKPKEENAD